MVGTVLDTTVRGDGGRRAENLDFDGHLAVLGEIPRAKRFGSQMLKHGRSVWDNVEEELMGLWHREGPQDTLHPGVSPSVCPSCYFWEERQSLTTTSTHCGDHVYHPVMTAVLPINLGLAL